jgi:hypothetical protein
LLSSWQVFDPCIQTVACLAITIFSGCLVHCQSISTLHFFCLIFITTSIITSTSYLINRSSNHLYDYQFHQQIIQSSLRLPVPSIDSAKSPFHQPTSQQTTSQQPSIRPTSMESSGSFTLSDSEGYFERERFKTARLWESWTNPTEHMSSEHHVARYVMFIILRVFNLQDWNIVPQFYTHAGKWPDLVLESFQFEPKKVRGREFIPRAFIELKQKSNPEDPIQQLLNSIEHEWSRFLSSKGYLIGIKGTDWTIMEFQRVIPDAADKPITLLHNFYENPYSMPTEGRPIPSRSYTKTDTINISNKQGFDDMLKALRYIAEYEKSRDFAEYKQHVKRLPVSLTVPTLPGHEHSEDEDLSAFDYMNDLFWESFGGTIFVVAEWFFLGVMVVLLRVVLIVSVGFEHSTYSILSDLYLI